MLPLSCVPSFMSKTELAELTKMPPPSPLADPSSPPKAEHAVIDVSISVVFPSVKIPPPRALPEGDWWMAEQSDMRVRVSSSSVCGEVEIAPAIAE